MERNWKFWTKDAGKRFKERFTKDNAVSSIAISLFSVFIGPAAMQSWPSLLTGSAGFLFVWIAIFFLYLLTAPYRTEREAHDTLKSSDAFKAYQRAIDILGIESSFTLSEAACLLARQEIVRSDPKGVASFFITRIKQAIVDGSIGSNVPKSTIDLIKAQRMMAGFGGQTQVAELPDDAMISKKTLLALSAKYDVPLL